MEQTQFKFRVQNSDDVVKNQYHLFLQKAKAIYFDSQTTQNSNVYYKEEGDENFKIYQLIRKVPTHRNTLIYKRTFRDRRKGPQNTHKKHNQAILR